jgi:hypothetical protein
LSILKTRNGTFGRPKYLMFLEWARDCKGFPIFGGLENYVSQEYPASVWEALLWLGVTAPTWLWVVRNIQSLHDAGLLAVKLQDKEWCSDIAKVILDAQDASETTKASDLRDIPLIPLTDGTWCSSPTVDGSIYFPVSLGMTIPPGLPLSLVDEAACLCTNRRRLFRLLGVKDCEAPDVINRIFDYHTSLTSAEEDHIIVQLKYLYTMRGYIRSSGDMRKILFSPSDPDEFLREGSSMYADIAGKLQQLFSGYEDVTFLSTSYFDGYSPSEKFALAEWLEQTTDMALAPRLHAPPSFDIHKDFQWLLNNKSNRVLEILRQNWAVYEKHTITRAIIKALGETEFLCRSGSRVALRKTFLPIPALLEKVKAFGNPESCNFLSLPSGTSEDWKFLAIFGVGLGDGLDFYLWLHTQRSFQEQRNVNFSRQLYLALQSRAFSPAELQKVRQVFTITSLVLSFGIIIVREQTYSTNNSE